MSGYLFDSSFKYYINILIFTFVSKYVILLNDFKRGIPP